MPSIILKRKVYPAARLGCRGFSLLGGGIAGGREIATGAGALAMTAGSQYPYAPISLFHNNGVRAVRCVGLGAVGAGG